ncbi:conserved hypothetical protein [Pseudomonas protegens Pf-5]|uniref:Uncharacterized protein n=1 Tax=Pseudomonas fluorescens (strain ATCC BAA-477 / NRRL B-23932 / Pf-5) TaxID=220664 RepID=Q4KHM5_PSEF5|nr:conserved hypothetical protein [Pseudomonas protegens Pf-5]
MISSTSASQKRAIGVFLLGMQLLPGQAQPAQTLRQPDRQQWRHGHQEAIDVAAYRMVGKHCPGGEQRQGADQDQLDLELGHQDQQEADDDQQLQQQFHHHPQTEALGESAEVAAVHRYAPDMGVIEQQRWQAMGRQAGEDSRHLITAGSVQAHGRHSQAVAGLSRGMGASLLPEGMG